MGTCVHMPYDYVNISKLAIIVYTLINGINPVP